jgi:hypothetical protein
MMQKKYNFHYDFPCHHDIQKRNLSYFQFSLNVFCSTLSEFENFVLCGRILINDITCQNETSS